MNFEEDQVWEFSKILGKFMQEKGGAASLYNEKQAKYIHYFLTWFKENGVIPVEYDETIDPNDPIAEVLARIEYRSQKYKDECDKVCEEIGLKSLKLKNRLPHCSPLQYEQEEYLVMDNPCAGGHVIQQLAVPVAFLAKCLVLGCVPALVQETNHA